jgi:hypothetical protein
MANPAGESNDEVLKLDFDRRLMLQFRGSSRISFNCRPLPHDPEKWKPARRRS